MPPMPGRSRFRHALIALGRRLPQTSGTRRVAGLDGPVRIARDRWGIAYVEATTDADGWFGLGFCHGQDRGFQLELLARAGRGTLSELFGPATLALDRFTRTLGFGRLAAAQRGSLDPDAAETLEAYVAGVNAAASASPRPHELVLLRGERSAWTVEDVLAFLGLQSLALAGNWDSELARLAILAADGSDALAAVDATYASWLPVAVPPGAMAGPAVDRLAVDLAGLRALVGGSGASNAWALAAARTSSGAPILANDPHLAASVPAPWYLASVRTPSWAVAGASFVGGPAFPSGHNGHAAWGITAGCADAADLFWEELDLESGTARGPHGPEPITRLHETIGIRGGTPEALEVVVTARGPVVTPALHGIGASLSLRATWLQPAPVRGLLDACRARDFASFREAFRAWPGPSLNVVYADADGHVGYQLVGTLPRRRRGNGTLPAPAWEEGWEGEPLPFDELPWTLDPDVGFVATANNAPAGASAGAFLGVDWLDGYRATRIVERLTASDSWDVASTAALQVDVLSVPWFRMRDAVLAAPVNPDARLAHALLRGWDGRVDADSAAASVFELFVAELACRLVREEAPASWRWAMGAGFGDAVPRTSFGARTVSRLMAALESGPDHGPQISAALADAQAKLVAARGSNPSRWAWGSVRPLWLRHALSPSAALNRAFSLGPMRIGGDTNTVAQAGVRPLDPMGDPAAIANHRMVIDLGDLERSRFALAGGQSGNPLSPHYDDLLAPWLRGEGVPIAWSSAAIEASAVDVMELRPHDTRNAARRADVWVDDARQDR